MPDIRVAVDVGGTFTDVVALDPASGRLRFDKVATTPDSPTDGVLGAFDKTGVDPAEVTTFHHGTTLGLNALLTRTGARTAVVATRGFRDVYLLGRTDRRVNYDIRYHKPEPLLRRRDTFEVTERSLFDGTVATPLDEDDARRVATEIARRGYEAVAVCFLHSYANPAHEARMREILHEVCPEVAVTVSHDLSREYREYERTSTAVLDAYIKPVVRGYLTRLEEELADRGFTGRFLVSRSGGGGMTCAAAREQPVNLILSGPAGGVVGAAGFARLTGRRNLITIDMGGTSLDASLVLDGQPVLHQGAEFEGLPINTPSLYIHTIGAGGGSLAYLDEAGALQVGPRSAGAVPGPVAYGRGGTQPTVTDAALAVGYLGADTPLGGSLALDTDAALAALRDLAGRLGGGLDERQLAQGILRISHTKIVGAVRAITVELGHDPKDFALLSFGGAGGLVAVDVARQLGIPAVIVPPGQGAFSALGMLMADVQHDFARTAVAPLADLDAAAVEQAFADLTEQAQEVLAGEGFPPERRLFTRTVDVRYTGQEHAVTVPYDGSVAAVEAAFSAAHERQYGHVMDDPVEVTTLRLRAVGLVDKPELPTLPEDPAGAGTPRPAGTRTVYPPDGTSRAYALFLREDLRRGQVVDGPAVVSEHTATTVLHAGDRLTVGRHGELVISVAPEEQR